MKNIFLFALFIFIFSCSSTQDDQNQDNNTNNNNLFNTIWYLENIENNTSVINPYTYTLELNDANQYFFQTETRLIKSTYQIFENNMIHFKINTNLLKKDNQNIVDNNFDYHFPFLTHYIIQDNKLLLYADEELIFTFVRK